MQLFFNVTGLIKGVYSPLLGGIMGDRHKNFKDLMLSCQDIKSENMKHHLFPQHPLNINILQIFAIFRFSIIGTLTFLYLHTTPSFTGNYGYNAAEPRYCKKKISKGEILPLNLNGFKNTRNRLGLSCAKLSLSWGQLGS